MPTRTAAALLASVLTGALLATTWGAPADAAKREDTCFAEEPIRVPLGESYTGTSADEVILGGARVEGGAGDDLICDAAYVLGGPGDDRIRMLDGGTARGNGGNDEFVSIVVSETPVATLLIGGPGSDVFYGSPLGEEIFGGAGADVVRSGGGDDIVDLGSGNDQGYGGPGDDTFTAGTGDDFVDGSTETDAVDGGPGIDRCRGVESRTSCVRVR